MPISESLNTEAWLLLQLDLGEDLAVRGERFYKAIMDPVSELLNWQGNSLVLITVADPQYFCCRRTGNKAFRW